jgi:hypothetical protein
LLLLAKQQQQKNVDLYTISVCYAWALVRNDENLLVDENIVGSCQKAFPLLSFSRVNTRNSARFLMNDENLLFQYNSGIT